jgi:hypothetical protein
MSLAGAAGDTVRAWFAADGLGEVVVYHRAVSEAEAVRAFQERRQTLGATLGAGRAGLGGSWVWAGRDSTSLALVRIDGRVIEFYTSKYIHRGPSSPEAGRAQPAPRPPETFTFGDISWEGGIEAATRRLQGRGYRLVGADSTYRSHQERIFARGRSGDSVMVMFSPAGVRSIWWYGDSLPEPRAAEAYRVRLAALASRYGPGEPGPLQPSHVWRAADRSRLLVTSHRGRLQETYFSPHQDRTSAAQVEPRVARSTPRPRAGWHAGRVSSATWRPTHVAGTSRVVRALRRLAEPERG